MKIFFVYRRALILESQKQLQMDKLKIIEDKNAVRPSKMDSISYPTHFATIYL